MALICVGETFKKIREKELQRGSMSKGICGSKRSYGDATVCGIIDVRSEIYGVKGNE
jgi:hypothetical protein